jgi:hypothetical protein
MRLHLISVLLSVFTLFDSSAQRIQRVACNGNLPKLDSMDKSGEYGECDQHRRL